MANQRHLVDAYEPIEDILARPKVRILRALRWFGWVTAADLFTALDLSDWVRNGDNRERLNYTSTLRGLVNAGRVERDGHGRGVEHAYRLTDLGRADLARMLRKYEESIGAQRRAA